MAYRVKSNTDELMRKVLALREQPDDGSQFSPALLHEASRPFTWAAISQRLGISPQRARVPAAKHNSESLDRSRA